VAGTGANTERYFNTVRHLRLRQVAARVRRRLVMQTADTRPHPRARERVGALVPPPARADEWLAPDRVRLLNIERSFPERIDWAPVGMPRLWVYHLHYFSDLPQSARRPDRAWLADVVASWIAENPPGASDAWDPYPTSLRILNWVKWLLLAGPGAAPAAAGVDGGVPRAAPGDQRERVLQSLAVQTRFLARRLEFDIAANHLLANAVALTAAGFLFGAGEGDRWLKRGLRLLRHELAEQTLPDGGHFERSPMYQAIVLEQLLDVLNLCRAFPDAGEGAVALRAEIEAKTASMLDWLGAMVHPDGEIAFFNDATLGVAATHAELASYAGRLGLEGVSVDERGSRTLKETGYFRLVSDDGRTVVIFDAGRIGPDYQPGHGHCDALSLEVSRDGERVLVNSGVSTYEAGEQRLRERQTESHNTVRVDGEEQCEVWSVHRCGRRLGILAASSSGSEAEGRHSGFCHLPGAPLHHRRVSVAGKAVTVTDGFDGAGEHGIEWFLHLHPDVSLRPVAGGFELSRHGGPFAVLRVPAELGPSVEDSLWHSGFNASVPNQRVIATWKGRIPCDFVLELRWL
jgi:hypothetical protein